MFSEFSEMKEFNNDKRSERPHILGGEITQLQHMTGEKSIRIVKILKIRIVKMNEKMETPLLDTVGCIKGNVDRKAVSLKTL